MTRRRSVLVWSLLVLASLLLLISSLTVWSKRQLLNTDNFTKSSAKLLANDEIRVALSARLIDLFNQRVDLTDQLEERLPPRAKSAAPVAAAAIQNSAGRVIDSFLATPQAQELWERVNRRAHTALVNVLEGKDAGPISTANGDVVLDLRPFLQRIATRLGVSGDRLKERAPPESGQIVLLESDQLDAAQTAVRILKALSSLLVLLVLALFALAIYLAPGSRRTKLEIVGLCFVVVGLLLAVIRRVVGGAIIDSLVSTAASKPAVNAIWLIETDLLRDIAVALMAYGLLAILAGFLAGPSRPAVAVRRWLAPTFRNHRGVVYAAAAFIFLLLIAWGPTGASRQWLGIVVFGLLLGAGLEVWRRQIVREFPEGSAAVSRDGEGQLDDLERLARLRSSGALTETEFEAQKAALLSPH
jgi:Short C-terminal domain